MANTPQSIKRARQAQTRHRQNQTARTHYRTMVKRARAAAAGGDATAAKDTFAQMQSVADRAARKNLFHPKTVSRVKSRINKILKAAATARTEKATEESDDNANKTATAEKNDAQAEN